MLMRKLKYVWLFLAAYLIFAVLGSAIPHLFTKTIDGDTQNQLIEAITAQAPGADRVTLISTVEDGLSVRLALIGNAQSSLDIVYHNVKPGESTRAFFYEIIQAAERGVEIRMMLDGKVGANREVQTLLDLANRYPNISYSRFNTFHLLRPWQWHTVLHDKFIIADQTYLLLGGRNIGDRYFNPAGYESHVVEDRDVLVWRTDAAAESVLTQALGYMNLLWDDDLSKLQPGKSVAPQAGAKLEASARRFAAENPLCYDKTLDDYLDLSVAAERITLLHNPIDTGNKPPWIGYQIYYLLNQAEQRVIVQTPYATANKNLLAAIEQVSGKAPVQILTNSLASTPNYLAYSNYYYNRHKFLRANANIYEYQNDAASLHAKAFLIDDRISIIGSLNLDDRSLYIDTETMLVIESPEFTAQLNEQLDNYLRQSLLVNEANAYEQSGAVSELTVSRSKTAAMWVASIFSRLFQFLI